MSVRRRLTVLLPLIALLLLGSALTTPAGAVVVPLAVPDPVAVTVDPLTQGQNQGGEQTWQIPVSWTASATATGYTVKITSSDGGSTYATKDVSTTSHTFTVSTLLDNWDYKATVTPVNGDGPGTAAEAPFTAIPLDRTAPTGTYVVAPTHAWLQFDFTSFDETETAAVTITQKVAPTDDTPSTTITRRVLAGDGSAAKSWNSGSTFQVTYDKAGTFTPQVELTDGFGNSRLIALSTVTIADDNTAPVVTVTRPDSSVRNRISAWRVVRGSATDVGTGVDAVLAMVMQKRGGVWYAYHFGKRRWIKGKPGKGEAYNLGHIKARPTLMTTNAAGQWRTPRIRGLKTGLISVHSAAFDEVLNLSFGKVVRQRITRS